MLFSFVSASLTSLGKAGRNTAKAETCLSGEKDVTSHELELDQGCFATEALECVMKVKMFVSSCPPSSQYSFSESDI